ncbi:MAG: hypothetical protein Q9221_003723 [Calogaya cf. arnoldii]
MFLSVIVIARDGNWTPSNGVIYATFLGCVICHGILASVMSKIMGKLQTVFVAMNFILIAATVIALPIGAKNRRNDGNYIFTQTENLTTWPKGWAFMLSWLSPIWTIGAFDSCVHMSEECKNASQAVPAGILMSIGSCWLFGLIIMIVLAATISPDLESVIGSKFGQPMAQIYYDAIGKSGTMGLMSLLFIVQFLMGISILVAASRQTWAFSRDGALPFSSFFRPISQRFGYIPLRAVWGCLFLAAVLGLLSLIAPAAAQALFSLAVAGVSSLRSCLPPVPPDFGAVAGKLGIETSAGLGRGLECTAMPSVQINYHVIFSCIFETISLFNGHADYEIYCRIISPGVYQSLRE